MVAFETIPTIILSKQNKIMSVGNLPELVHLHDSAKNVFIDFSKVPPVLVSPQTTIDEAIREMNIKHVQVLFVEEKGQVIGLIGQEDVLGERPIRLLQEKRLRRAEITVDLLMKPQHEILAIDAQDLKHAQVGHIINTIKAHLAYYILVIKKTKDDQHLIKGLFSASQLGKQLHTDLLSILTRLPETIVELRHRRKG